jgi:phenylacetate-CoA ligase
MFWNPSMERMPVEDLKEIQEKKLRILVNNVYNYSPFYKRKFKELGLHPSDIKGTRRSSETSFHKKAGFKG